MRQVEKRLKNRKLIIQECPQRFTNFEYEQGYVDAVKKMQKYFKHRRWMKAHGVDFSKFSEEQEFIELNQTYELEKKALTVKLTNAVFFAANKRSEEIQSEKTLENLRESKVKSC